MSLDTAMLGNICGYLSPIGGNRLALCYIKLVKCGCAKGTPLSNSEGDYRRDITTKSLVSDLGKFIEGTSLTQLSSKLHKSIQITNKMTSHVDLYIPESLY